MARKPKPKPEAEPAKGFDEFVEDTEAPDEDVNVELDEVTPPSRLRDWRDVERFKEMRELRKLVDDDIDLDEPGTRRRR